LLPTFVIGLREGVEASLIVGIVAAFLGRQGARRQLVWVWTGVAVAVLLCLGAAVGLEILDTHLPQKQQEALETVIAFIAVGMVTWMILWMSRHAHQLKRDLESQAGEALAAGSGWALVLMAFLAVLREGLETAVFLLSAFQASTNRSTATVGALLGIAVAVAIGVAIYRGGVRIDLGRLFFLTSLVLVLVAGGLVSFGLHTVHEAGWINAGQAQALDLSWLVSPGSVQSALITGVLGIQPKPTVVEAIGWTLFVVPMVVFVWRADTRRRRAAAERSAGDAPAPDPPAAPARTPSRG
jgi:high-affinity iron transporter